MKVITVASQKGGSGKTTLARSLAVAASGAVALVDTDPQGTLTDWWNRRAADTPILSRPGPIAETLAVLQSAGIDLVVIDTPPSVHDFIGDVLRLSSFVLVPCRPSPDDLSAIGPTLDLIAAAGRDFAFVLSMVKPRIRLATAAVRVLAAHGKVAPVSIGDRVEHPTAAATGQTAAEIDSGGPAAGEIQQLLAYVLKHLSMELPQ